MAKRLVRVCEGCGWKRQYYRKASNTWRCYHCGLISGGETEEEEQTQKMVTVFKKIMEYELIPADSVEGILNAIESPYKAKIKEFIDGKNPIVYIQFENKEEFDKFHAGLASAARRHELDIRVLRRTRLLRVYLVKKTT